MLNVTGMSTIINPTTGRPHHWIERLNNAFRDLRKQGFVARQNFSCCGTCAWCELATMIGERVTNGRVKVDAVRGVVFFHRQDAAHLDNDGGCFIAFGAVFVSELDRRVGDDAAESGRVVNATFHRHGFNTIWDGNPDKRIYLIVDPAKHKHVNPYTG